MADSFGARFRGLMGRATLPPGDGLWLTGTSNIHMFFMRFSIDAVFLGRPAPDGTPARRWPSARGFGRGSGSSGGRAALTAVSSCPAGTAALPGTRPGDLVRLEPEA